MARFMVGGLPAGRGLAAGRAANGREFFRPKLAKFVNGFLCFFDRLRKHSFRIAYSVLPTCAGEMDCDGRFPAGRKPCALRRR